MGSHILLNQGDLTPPFLPLGGLATREGWMVSYSSAQSYFRAIATVCLRLGRRVDGIVRQEDPEFG